MQGRTTLEAMYLERARILAYFALALMVAALVGMLRATPAHADAFTVNSTSDSGTGGCDLTECTLREAITAANDNNNDPTVDFINFAITGAGPHAISISSGPDLPSITEAVTINGYSQTGASANTNGPGQPDNAVLKIVLSGTGAGNGLKIEASNSTVQGLVLDNWENGVFLATGATDSQVMGSFIGAGVSGSSTEGNTIGVAVSGHDNTIGGTTAAARNIISANGSGVSINGTGNVVQGNYIGTKSSGAEPLANTGDGVVILGTASNTIGGTTASARNVISGNRNFGIRIWFTGATLNKVQGNYIGISAAGDTTLGNGNDGVSIQVNADNNTIGGTKSGSGNLISGNGGNGVEVVYNSNPGADPDPAAGNSILSNSIYANDALGIDLCWCSNDPPGVTENDTIPPFDSAGTGPNHLQNFPDITSARLTTKRTGGHRRKVTLITGTLHSTPSTATVTQTFTLQFFGSPVADQSGNGEGKTFLGKKSVTTNDSGNASFTFTSRKKVPVGQVVTATATKNSTGDTSEFSDAVPVS